MVDQELLLELTQSYLKNLVSEVTNSSIDNTMFITPFQELGLDSFRVLQIVKQLEGVFGTLPKTLLFENFNLNDLTNYFMKKYNEKLVKLFADRLKHVDESHTIMSAPSVDAPERLRSAHSSVDLNKYFLISEKDALKHPELSSLIKNLFSKYRNEGSVSRGTRNIAPNLFIGSERKGYFNYARSRNILLVYAYTGPQEYFQTLTNEIYQYCLSSNYELNIFSIDQIQSVGDFSFSATPFGVIQRINDLTNFTLAGNKMRRLRYQVSKFEEAGVCETKEYKCGSNKEIDQKIGLIIDAWCSSRTMVNPLIYIVKDEILNGTLADDHRIFLTYLNNELLNAILITQMSSEENGYLMDLEFYTQDMPTGGLEYAIVKIIEKLVSEGCTLLSLGGTYGIKLEPSINPDPEVDKILDTLREKKIFNDDGNLQFKNKFRTENIPIYLCRPLKGSDPNNVTDIIMMIADPASMQDSEEHETTTNQLSSDIQHESIHSEIKSHSEESISKKSNREVLQSSGTNARLQLLSENGYNPLNIPNDKIDIDLKTDSWAQLESPFITNRISQLHEGLQQQLDLYKSLKNIFPFTYFALTGSGRTAEHVFFKASPRKGKVLQNLLFPTTIFNQIENGFTPVEIPTTSIFQTNLDENFKGNIDADLLEKQLKEHCGSIVYVYIELCNNAAGGYPVAFEHLKKIKEISSKFAVPLVLDATRILENAYQQIMISKEYCAMTIWEVVNEYCSQADIVVASLTKDFCVSKGGLIATNDNNLFNAVKEIINQEGIGLDAIDKKVIASALHRKKFIEQHVIQRMENVQLLWKQLQNRNLPVLRPVGGHCVVVDVQQIAEFKSFKYSVPSFIAWLYLNTGIRASAHNSGLQKKSALSSCVRLAIPIGLTFEQTGEVAQRVISSFNSMKNIPELLLENSNSNSLGDIHISYTLKETHNLTDELENKPALTIRNEGHAAESSFAGIQISKSKESEGQITSAKQPTSLAIVGMAGRYPKAQNVHELWKNLFNGVDCIETIPDDRFNRRLHNNFAHKYRGGFVDNVDKFDSLFFNISPKEAELLDPQERLFLEVAWETIEDAGYYPELLTADPDTRNIGVFVGAVWTLYQLVGVEEKLFGNNVSPGSMLWSIANRVSYWMNFSGPSLTLDTACSSSLTAIYLACESIQRGECRAAIVGGVNLDLHQNKWDINYQNGFGALSEDGVCRTFGKGANGYVAGEGVGAIFIRPLEDALKNGDNIYGIIKSAVVNHGGRTSGYMVPSPNAQSELVRTALEKGKIDARSIGYIEAHGTGTKLGDPIEITGLTNAFESYSVANQSCAIGSVKTNIGHLEAAAGIVGIQKVLLQMKYRKLVPSLHSTELNEFIDFKNSPFYVEQSVEDWKGRVIDGVSFPLRAGISSFGAGGANAHVIIEQYESRISDQNRLNKPIKDHIFPLSARSKDQLREVASRLLSFLKDISSGGISPAPVAIQDIAYTLRAGRKSFDNRLAIIAESLEELKEKLEHFIKEEKDEKILSGQVKSSEGIMKLLSQKEKEDFAKLLCQNGNIQKLAQLWVEGLLSDWQGIDIFEPGRRVSLPTYPFAGKRLWVAEKSLNVKFSTGSRSGLHPLIDTNESTFERQIFKKTFTDQDFFIYDHLVSNIPTLPGVAYLDLARKAGELAYGRKVQRIKNVLWLSPLAVVNSKPLEVFIELKPAGDTVQFEVYSISETKQKQIYSQGKLLYASMKELEATPEFLDIETIQAKCTKVMDGKDAYPLFKSLGLHLGPSFQVLQEVYKNEEEVLGVLKLPEVRTNDFSEFLLHPSLIDGTGQTGMAAQLSEKNKNGEMFVPYSFGEVEILHALPQKCYCHVRRVNEPNAKVSKANILVTDETGKILIKIHDSVGVPLVNVHEKSTQNNQSSEFEKLYYTLEWENTPLQQKEDHLNSIKSILLFDNDRKLFDQFTTNLKTIDKNSQVIFIKPGQSFIESEENEYTVNPLDLQTYIQLFETLTRKNIAFNNICFAWQSSTKSTNESNYDENFLTEALDSKIYPFFYLYKALIDQKIDNKINLLFLYDRNHTILQPHNDAINAFVKSARIEAPKIDCKVLDIQYDQDDLKNIVTIMFNELSSNDQNSVTIRYNEQGRQTRGLKKFDFDTTRINDRMVLKEKGIYLITGGAGGLGLIFAEYLAKTCQARLVLSGRSVTNPEIEKKIEKIKSLGGNAIYISADISSRNDLSHLIEQANSTFGKIHGIIHSAGVLRDSYLKNKSVEDLKAVFAPKVFGTVLLDELTTDINLDFFVMFSSMAGIGGNAGQCDYAFANHFMDSFAMRREVLCSQGKRHGKTISFNWSLWAEGGMKQDEQTQLFFKKNLGIDALPTSTGIDTFVNGLRTDKTHLAVVQGDQNKLETAWGLRKKEQPSQTIKSSQDESSSVSSNTAYDNDLQILIQDELSKIIMDMLKLDPEDIDLDKILMDLGFDSIGLTSFANAVNEKYGLDINPVLFFEYPSISAISKYIAAEHKDNALKAHQKQDVTNVAAGSPSVSQNQNHVIPVLNENATVIPKKWDPSIFNQEKATVSYTGFNPEKRYQEMPVAVVGIGGVMPQSDDMEEYWENLKDARSMITVVPRDRWNWEDYDGNPLKEKNKTNSRYGGFIREVDKFDPSFFGISKQEAEMMDPQQRLFLEVVWKAIEDSGHKVSDFSGTKTGLFVGAATRDYLDLMTTNQIEINPYTASGNSHSVLVNRVSFLLNLRGPSAPIDTACSSSLVALHRAIESIHCGSSEMAIVGGVNIILTPGGHISFGLAGILSSDGECRAFDKSASGYSRGEGVGAVVLKPLSKAEADGDHIYAVIRATAENHNGKVVQLAAPNPNSQSELLIEAYEKANINPTTVGYIECHGTGTNLGDPIEIQALTKTFSVLHEKHKTLLPDSPYCGLSSVKTNIGHLETAAGISGVLKVLLAMKNKQIPALVNFKELNPYINLKGSPFYIVDKTIPWQSLTDESGNEIPRRAGVSGFGFGGANAHVVFEEYVPKVKSISGNPTTQVIVLSAKNEDRLRAYAESMLQYLKKHQVNLSEFAYTLQVGRDVMTHRLAFVASDLAMVQEKFNEFIQGKTDTGIFLNVNGKKGISSANEEEKRNIKLLIDKKDFSVLAEKWVSGVDIDWSLLYINGTPQRISLPTYPFARERYWFETKGPYKTQQSAISSENNHLINRKDQTETLPIRNDANSRSFTYAFIFNQDQHHESDLIKLEPAEKADLFVKQMFATQLNVPVDEINLDCNLMDSGLTSINMAGITLFLKNTIDPEFSPTAFFECTTIKTLSDLMYRKYENYFRTVSIKQMETELTHDNTAQKEIGLHQYSDNSTTVLHLVDAQSELPIGDLTATPRAFNNELKCVLLTGATGFLGIHVLSELLSINSLHKILCLIRGKDRITALNRLREQAEKFKVSLDESKLEILCGDLNEPQLGLTGQEWNQCCREVQQIVHASAHVNHIEGYATFRDSTKGMKEIIKLASTSSIKLIHFISSIAACSVKVGDQLSVYEKESFLDDGTSIFGGYGQSKWVQETFLKRANEHGIPFVIYRFGELSGSSQTGMGQLNDMLHRLVQMKLSIDCKEKISSDVLDMVPVDFAAKFIVNTARTPELWNKIYHATHPNPFPFAGLYRLAEEKGFTYEAVTRDAYREKCYEYVKFIASKNPVDGFVLECVLRDVQGLSKNLKMIDVYFAILFPFNQDNFKNALQMTKLSLPDWKALFNRYFECWQQNDVGFMKKVDEFRNWIKQNSTSDTLTKGSEKKSSGKKRSNRKTGRKSARSLSTIGAAK